MKHRTCQIEGCDRPHYGRGMCDLHYQRWRKHGDPHRGYRTPEQRFWSKVNKTESCWLWTGGSNPLGYGTFWDGTRLVGAHRFSFALANGPIAEGASVLHACDIPACVNPDHLSLGTQADNIQDMFEKGRGIVGETQWSAKLTASDVRDIRRRAKTQSQASLAREYGVSNGAVSMIVSRQRWKHVG